MSLDYCGNNANREILKQILIHKQTHKIVSLNAPETYSIKNIFRHSSHRYLQTLLFNIMDILESPQVCLDRVFSWLLWIEKFTHKLRQFKRFFIQIMEHFFIDCLVWHSLSSTDLKVDSVSVLSWHATKKQNIKNQTKNVLWSVSKSCNLFILKQKDL